MRSNSKSWDTLGADFMARKSVFVWSKVTPWFEAKRWEYVIDHWSHFLWEGQFFCLCNSSVVLLLCKVTSAWNLHRVAGTRGGKYDIKLICFLKHSLRDTPATTVGMDSIQGWMFLADICFSSNLQGQPQQYNKIFQFSHGFPPKLSWKKRKCLCSPLQNAVVPKMLQWGSKIPRERIHCLRQAFKIIVYFFESVVYLKTIYCKSKKIVDNKKTQSVMTIKKH